MLCLTWFIRLVILRYRCGREQGGIHLQRLARLNGKAVFKSDPATGARVIPVKLIFVRHAETEWNRHGIIQGHKDSPLTARSALETSALLTVLTDAGYPVEGIFTSPLGRARHMGQALAGYF